MFICSDEQLQFRMRELMCPLPGELVFSGGSGFFHVMKTSGKVNVFR